MEILIFYILELLEMARHEQLLWLRYNSHYNDAIMGAMASQISNLTIVYSIVYSSTDQRKHQSSESLAIVWGIHRSPVNSPHKGPVTRKMFPFDDVIMLTCSVMREKYHLQYPKLKIHNMTYRNVLYFNTLPKISHNFRGIHQYIVNLRIFLCVQ